MLVSLALIVAGDADHLRELFDELVLPPPVRRAWAYWLRRHRRDQ